MANALQLCFWLCGSATFAAYAWGARHFWVHRGEPVWGGLQGQVFWAWVPCELAAVACFGLVTRGLWDSERVDWTVCLSYAVFLLGEGLWMVLTVRKWVELNRACVYAVAAASMMLAFQVAVARLSEEAVWPAVYLALHTTAWDALFWMRTWEAEVRRGQPAAAYVEPLVY